MSDQVIKVSRHPGKRHGGILPIERWATRP
jgi:hypothetical protein